MGYTPLEGLVMATRSGSVDPGILLHQLRQGLSADQLEQALSHQSGLLGLSTISGDMHQLRAIATGSQSSNQAAAGLAIAVFRHQIPADEEGLMACQCQQAASSGPSQAWRPVSPSHQE